MSCRARQRPPSGRSTSARPQHRSRSSWSWWCRSRCPPRGCVRHHTRTHTYLRPCTHTPAHGDTLSLSTTRVACIGMLTSESVAAQMVCMVQMDVPDPRALLRSVLLLQHVAALLETRLCERLRFALGSVYAVSVSMSLGLNAPVREGPVLATVSVDFTSSPVRALSVPPDARGGRTTSCVLGRTGGRCEAGGRGACRTGGTRPRRPDRGAGDGTGADGAAADRDRHGAQPLLAQRGARRVPVAPLSGRRRRNGQRGTRHL
jgi:hypothetical protein